MNSKSGGFSLRPRIATLEDCAAIRTLMDCSISELLGPFLTPDQLAASREIMGLDSQLIKDSTYFIVEIHDRVAGCGGWSRRARHFGGDHYLCDDARLLDPAIEPVRIRAMYTHPEFARCGVGRAVLMLCESAAAHARFRRAELVATLAGEAFYRACGYSMLERIDEMAPRGVPVPVVRMGKYLETTQSAGGDHSRQA